jgi:hypothetical protein
LQLFRLFSVFFHPAVAGGNLTLTINTKADCSWAISKLSD